MKSILDTGCLSRLHLWKWKIFTLNRSFIMKKTEMCWLKASVKPTKNTPICMHLWENEDTRTVFLGAHDGKKFIDFKGETVKPDHYFYVPSPPDCFPVEMVIKKVPIKRTVVKHVAKK